jgi:hypothetical protein
MLPLLLIAVLAQTPTAAYVHDLRPELGERRVARLAKVIDAAAARYDQDPMLLAAIVRTETYFDSGQKNCWPAPWRPEPGAITCDYGLAQVNEQWVKRWNLNAERLQHDDQYNLNVAARILAQIQKMFGAKEPGNWFGRYHSGTPSKRRVYEARLLQYLSRPALATL